MSVKLGIDSYSQYYIKQMNSFYPNLWECFDTLPSFPEEKSTEVISYLLGIACQSTHIGNIQLGRDSLWSLPRVWLVGKIQDIAYLTLDLNDDWEFRRLAEVYNTLDKNLLANLCQIGKQSKNPAVQEAANDFTEN